MAKDENSREKIIIGRQAKVMVCAEENLLIPAKIDTGAERSAIWASQIHIDKNHRLHFVFFDENSEFFSGKEHSTDNYELKLVKNSSGKADFRYQIQLPVEIAGRKVRGTFTLADRSENQFPMLIGAKLLKNKFLVDVARDEIKLRKMDEEKGKVVHQFKENPRKFFKKYHAKKSPNKRKFSPRNLLKKRKMR